MMKRMILKSPLVPLIIRLSVLSLSAFALGLSASIFALSSNPRPILPGADPISCAQQPSTYLALCFDAVAIIYILYITVDEYTSKPLGLRSASAKMRLIFFDLIFIVFDSANMSLAYDSLNDDRWACFDIESLSYSTCYESKAICQRQKGLTAVLFIALLAWLGTFAISTLR